MSTILYELPDRYVLDTGMLIGKHTYASKLVLAGQDLSGKTFIDNDDLRRFAEDTGQTPVLWSHGEPETPSPETKAWRIPEAYLSLDLEEFLGNLLRAYLSQNPTLDAEQYLERFAEELYLIQTKNMVPFIQTLIYMIDTFKEKNVVWGVGRGSSVESLILFLIDVNLLDPLLYNIELDHFYRR